MGPVARNTLYNLLGRLIPLVVAVVAVPMAVNGLGMARFGVLTLAWLLLDYANVFDLGLGRALTWAVAAETATAGRDRVRRLVWTAGALQVLLGALGGAALALLAGYLAETLLNVPADLVHETGRSFLILAWAIPVLLVYRSAVGLLEGLQRFDLVNAVRIPFGSATFALAGAAGWLGWALPSLIAALVALKVAALAVMAVLCLRTAPWVLPAARPARDAARSLLGYGGWVTVSTVIAPILVYVERFLIGILRPVAAVGLYTPSAEAVRRFLIVPGSLTQAMFPAIAEVGAEGGERVTILFARAFKLIALAMGAGAIPLVLFAEPLLVLWLGPDFAGEPAAALRILALGMCLNGLAYLPFVTLEGLGRPDLPARLQMIELPLYVAAAFPVIRSWGIVGAAWLWAARVALDAVLLYGLALPRLNGIRRALAEQKALAALAAPVLLGTAMALVHQLPLDRGVSGTLLALLAAVGGLFVWRRLLSAADRATLRRLLRPRSDGVR